MTEQLTLFNIAPTQVIKSVVDPYWDEIECGKVDLVNSNEIHDDLDGLLSPSQLPESAHQQVAVGDWVKVSPEWLDKCRKAVDKSFHKYYQHKSKQDLVCKVIGLSDEGGVYIPRGPQRFFFVPKKYFEIALEHKAGTPCNCVGEQVNNGTHADTVHFLVGEQVESDTKKTAHQHDRQTTQHQKFTHWVEKYWVERSGHKHWYYRYAWMHGRKINRIYIGSAQSAIAKNRKSEIETAIADGESPADIQRLLKPQS
jgi:hypothetical protein